MTVFVFPLLESNFYTIVFFVTFGDGVSKYFSAVLSFPRQFVLDDSHLIILIIVIRVSGEMKRSTLLLSRCSFLPSFFGSTCTPTVCF